jgi:hypothetical protein
MVVILIELCRFYVKNQDFVLSLRCSTRLLMNNSEPTLRSRKVSMYDDFVAPVKRL